MAVMNEDAARRKTIIRVLMERGVDINAQAIEVIHCLIHPRPTLITVD